MRGYAPTRCFQTLPYTKGLLHSLSSCTHASHTACGSRARQTLAHRTLTYKAYVSLSFTLEPISFPHMSLLHASALLLAVHPRGREIKGRLLHV